MNVKTYTRKMWSLQKAVQGRKKIKWFGTALPLSSNEYDEFSFLYVLERDN